MATELETLVADAACWTCVSTRKQLEVQTYIIAYASGLGVDPEALSDLARGLDGLSFERLMAILGYVFGQFNADVAAGSANAQDIVNENPCYRCLSNQQALNLQTYMLSQDARGPTPRDPDSLVDLARCFCGLSVKRLLMIQIYLLAHNAGLSTDPEDLENGATGGGFVSLPPGTLLPVIFVSVLVNIEHHYVGGIGPIGEGCAEATAIPVLITPVYGINDAGQTDVLLNFTATAPCVCTGATLQLYGSNNADGSDATLISTEPFTVSPQIEDIPSPHPDYLYFYMTQDCPGFESAASNILPLIDPAAVAAIVTDYDNRVQANGGAALTGPTVTYLGTFIQDLMAHDLIPLIEALNVFVPDSLTAAITPLIVGPGNDPWTNTNFIAGDLSKYGLKGNGVNKRLNTGVTSADLGATDISLAGLIDDLPSTADGIELGAGTGNSSYAVFFWQPFSSGGTPYTPPRSQADLPFDAFAGRFTKSPQRTGYMLVTRNALNSGQLYFADPWNPHALAETRANAVNDHTTALFDFAAFAVQTSAGNYSAYCPRRVRMLMLGHHFTQAQSSNFYAAVTRLRQSWEDGIQTYAENWATRVVRNGGAAPAAATVTAIDNFLDALDTTGLLTKMVEVNIFAPDNLTAALTLAYRQDGCDMWTNTNFVAGDLSVDGLKGNGVNKYLVSGFFANMSMTDDQDAGVTIYNTFASNAGTYDVSCVLTALPGYAMSAYIDNGSNHYWDCWNQVADRIGPFLDANFTGYFSCNRGTDLGGGIKSAIFTASSTRAHQTTGSSLVAASGARIYQTPGVFCNVQNTVAGGAPTAHRYSFVAFHHGLTSAQSATFYALVQALRVELGGGFI